MAIKRRHLAVFNTQTVSGGVLKGNPIIPSSLISVLNYVVWIWVFWGEGGWVFHLWMPVTTALGIWSYLGISTVGFFCLFFCLLIFLSLNIAEPLAFPNPWWNMIWKQKWFQNLPDFSHYINFILSNWFVNGSYSVCASQKKESKDIQQNVNSSSTCSW